MTAIYTDPDQFKSIFTRLFADVQAADSDGLSSVTKRRMVVRFRVAEPETDMWIDGRSNPVQVYFGDQEQKPTLTASLTAATLHELLLGTLPLGKAISSRRLKVSGSLFKALRLEDLFHQCQSRYPELAAEMLGSGA